MHLNDSLDKLNRQSRALSAWCGAADDASVLSATRHDERNLLAARIHTASRQTVPYVAKEWFHEGTCTSANDHNVRLQQVHDVA